MLRLQAAKLPATVMTFFCHDYVIKLYAKRKSLFSAQQQSCFAGMD